MDIYLCEMSSSDCPRNIKSLQEGIKSMDAEYDKCHDVWAKGELKSFDDELLYHKYMCVCVFVLQRNWAHDR